MRQFKEEYYTCRDCGKTCKRLASNQKRCKECQERYARLRKIKFREDEK